MNQEDIKERLGDLSEAVEALELAVDWMLRTLPEDHEFYRRVRLMQKQIPYYEVLLSDFREMLEEKDGAN